MTRRRIVLTLADYTTETHCRSCAYLDFYDAKKCDVFGLLDPPALRSYSCRGAEVKNEDGAIIRLLALLVRAPTDDDGRPEIECSREMLVDMAMAARKELDALRAKTKDEEE
jgi:hypothetical protein